MRILKLKIVDWFSGDFDSNFIVKILRKNGYECVESENPDYLIYSTFGYENAKYDCVKIFYTGENIIPDFNVCDYAIGVNHIAFEDRYLYFPLYLLYADSTAKAAKKHENATLTGKDRFCNYIYSNKLAAKIRGDFFEFLNAYKRVDAPGADKNNCPRLPKNSDGDFTDHKFEFMQRYKFSIAFENSATRGYVTEKIIQAFAAGTIPIYWGDKSVAAGIRGAFEADNGWGGGSEPHNLLALAGGGQRSEQLCSGEQGGSWRAESSENSQLDCGGINPKSFINVDDYDDFEAVLARIKELDSDDEKYLSMLREPTFLDPDFPSKKQAELESFLLHIFAQKKDAAFRRKNEFWYKNYEWEYRFSRRIIGFIMGIYYSKCAYLFKKFGITRAIKKLLFR